MPDQCPAEPRTDDLRDRIGRVEGRVSTFEIRLEATATAQVRLEERIDAHHREIMEAVGRLEHGAAQREGERAANHVFWKRAAIVASVLGAMAALGWLGTTDTQAVETIQHRQEDER